MNKFLIIIILTLACISCNAQIYTHIIHVDKFDDIVKSEEHKTLITMSDTTIVVEEKGKEPVKYYILLQGEDLTMGSKENPVNLASDVYGYQIGWFVVRSDMRAKCLDALGDYMNDKSEANMNRLAQIMLGIVHRTITTKYSGEYLHEVFWIEEISEKGMLGKDVKRIIYSKE